MVQIVISGETNTAQVTVLLNFTNFFLGLAVREGTNLGQFFQIGN